MNKLGKKALAVLLTGAMVLGGTSTVFAASTSNEVSEREEAHAQLSREIAAQGMVLLENKDSVLPMKAKSVALFGAGAQRTVKGGTGSGDVNQRDTVNVKQGLENAGIKITSESFLTRWLADCEKGEAENPGGFFGAGYRHPDELITEEEMAEAKEGTDTAIYVISRNSGEFADRTMNGDYELSDVEKENLAAIGQNFDKVIVVLNVGGIIDTKFFDEIEGLDSMLLMSQAGMRGGDAVTDVLTGKVTPSGKLTDTWAVDYEDYPSSENFANNDGNSTQEDYTEGIYNGYRYFDTFGVDVSYEFGYGLSYTDFSMQVDEVRVADEKVSVDVTVTNTGYTYSGKEVVEVYYSAPENDTEEVPYQELAAYAKTDELAPGQSQKLTVSYNVADMASYVEADAAYELFEGDYIVRVGNSSRNTEVAAVITNEKNQITEQLSNQMAADKEIEELSNADATPITYEGEAEEIANAPKFAMGDVTTQNNASEYDDETVTTYVTEGTDVSTLPQRGATVNGKTWEQEIVEVPAAPEGTKLIDVYNGKVSIESFVAGMDYDTLGNITNGASSSSVSGPVVGAQANSVRGAAGETTSLYYDSLGIPNTVLADGPAGIRITQQYTQNDETYYQFCTAWPIGTLLAQSWDVDLVCQFGKAIGVEMDEYGVTLWLAPGMNIHRNPLCGRNFEYYSEDPFIAGTMAAAATKGVQTTPGIGVTLKHFAGNSQETNRNSENNTMSERTLREIYLKGFEIAVKSAQPMAVMSSYNKNNGRWAAGDYDLLTDILRGEWNFQGVVMTDWGAAAPKQESMHAGNDMIMPGNSGKVVADTLRVVNPEFGEDGYVTSTRSWWSSVENWNDFVLAKDEDEADDATKAFTVQVAAGVELNEKVAEKVASGVAMVMTKSGRILKGEKLQDTSEDRTVYYFGNMSNATKLYLGDVQKSVITILEYIMETSQFQKLNPEVELVSHTEKYADILKDYVAVDKSTVKDGATIADKGLEKIIEMVESLDPSEYTKESWADVEEALAAAKDVAADENATQAEVDKALSDLIKAFGKLEYGVQKLHLEVAIEAAEAILAVGNDYEDIEGLIAAVEAGKIVLADEEATQETVDNAAYAVLDQLFKMARKADLKSLETLLEASKGLVDEKYTSTSLENLKDAIEKAEAVVADHDRTDSDIADAYAGLIDAIIQLEMRGNKAALAAMIVKAEAVVADENAYVADTLEGLSDVLAEAKVVYENDDALQDEIDEAVKALTLKVADARLIGDVDGDGSVTTGDSAVLLLYAAEAAELSADQSASADVNRDGSVDTGDAVMILQYVAEKIAAF